MCGWHIPVFGRPLQTVVEEKYLESTDIPSQPDDAQCQRSQGSWGEVKWSEGKKRLGYALGWKSSHEWHLGNAKDHTQSEITAPPEESISRAGWSSHGWCLRGVAGSESDADGVWSHVRIAWCCRVFAYAVSREHVHQAGFHDSRSASTDLRNQPRQVDSHYLAAYSVSRCVFFLLVCAVCVHL